MALRRLRSPALIPLCLALAAPAAAGPSGPDHPWPPAASVYQPVGTEIAPGVKIGDVIGAETVDRVKDLLPPEIVAHYKSGGYVNPIISWPDGILINEKGIEEATKQNTDKFGLDPATGAIVDKATSKPATGIYGNPFPTIDEKDDQAGLKALWNQFYTYWHQGSVRAETLIIWANPEGVDRISTNDVYYQYYQNQHPRYRTPNPQDFTWQFIAMTKTPADLDGTVAMSYRYQDPKKRDSVWTFVPALRRVRPVSPANRSDGFLGSDLSQDDGNFFDGKPEDFVWKTVGLRDGLRIADPYSINGTAPSPRWMKEKTGWHNDWPADLPASGYAKEGWKGLAWAPVNSGLAKRRFWIVEGVPRDRYYLYGKIELWIDAETWAGAWNRKFSWKGELLNTYGIASFLNYPALREDQDDVEWMAASQQTWQCAENVKMNRATLAGIRARPDGPLDRRVTLDVGALFNLQTLTRMGK
jgi:hypothetical protein